MSNSIVPLFRCRGECNRELPRTAEYFHRDKCRYDGLMMKCKDCRNKEKREYNEANRETVRAQKRVAHLRTREKDNQRSNTWHHANKEWLNPQRNEKIRANPTRNRERSKQWYADHPERVIARSQAYYANNTEYVRERAKKYRLANIEQARANSKASVARRRARMKNVEGTYNRHDIERIFKDQEGRCVYCGITLFLDIPYDTHADHVIPIANGGTNWPDNIALTCQSCNLSKGDKLYEDWLAVRGW